MFRQRSRGSTRSINADSSTPTNGGAAAALGARPLAAAVAVAAAEEDRGQSSIAASTARRVTLPALSWSMAWTPGKMSSSGQPSGASKATSNRKRGRGSSSGAGEASSLHSSVHGMTDFRLIPRWSFFTQPLREPEEKTKTSIGTLYVKVVEGRGLMASDLSGRSDPYVKLCLTGRYLSNGQEWSEKLRLRETTKIIKYSLNPVWDEEFSMPVRRSGAVLKIGVWDWDRSSSDDPLGHFEVSIGEELLSQQPLDMWYVLEAPPRKAAAAQATAEKKLRRQQGPKARASHGGGADGAHGSSVDDAGEGDNGNDNDNDHDNDNDEEDETPDSPIGFGDSSIRNSSRNGNGYPAASLRARSASNKLIFRRRSSSLEHCDHSHESGEEERACETCIKRRRKLFGEVRLVMWYQFDEFAEMCSHTWPEEPLKQGKMHFSPNELYRKGMIFWQMAQPYVSFMEEADAILCWGRPWRSLTWMIALVGMLVVPPVLIVVLNAALMRIVVSAYLKHRRCGGGEGCGDGDGGGAAAAAATNGSAGAAAAPLGQRGGRPASSSSSSSLAPYSSSDHREGVLGASAAGETGILMSPPSTPTAGRRRSSSSQNLAFSPAAFLSWPLSPTPDALGHSASGDANGGEGLESVVAADGGPDLSIASSTPSQKKSKRFPLLSRTLSSRGGQGRRTSSDPDSAATVVGYSTGGGGMRNSSSAPSWYSSSGANAPRSAPTSALTTPSTTGHATSFFASSAAPPTASPVPSRPSVASDANGGPNSNLGLRPSSMPVKMRAAGAVAKGKGGMMSAAGAGGMKIKNLLPTRRDPELQELYARLGSTKKVPAVVNEVGKRLLSKSGPGLQLGLEKMGRNLIQIRQRFHPLHVKELVLAMVALVFHMVLQLWLYLTGRFNLYFALLVVGQFMNKLYKRWGKAFVMAMKEARRSYRTRQTLAHRMSAAAAAAAAATTSPSRVSIPTGGQPSSFSDEGAISAVVPNPFKFDATNPPAFAPPGATPAVEPYPSLGSENAARQSSSFFARSPVRGMSSRGRGSGSGSSNSAATSASDGGGGSQYSSRGGSGLLTPRGRRGSVPSPRTTPVESPTRSRSIASEGTAANGVATFGGAASAVSHGARGGGGRSRRWSAPWGKRVGIRGGGGGGAGARGGNLPGGGMTRYEEEGERDGQTGDTGFSSPVPPPRLRSRGGKTPSGRRATRRRVRWARVLGASVTLICVLTMLMVAGFAYVFPGDGLELGLEPSFPLAPLWQGVSGFGLCLLGQGEDDTVPGTTLATAWKSRLERFNFGHRGEVDDDDKQERETTAWEV